MKLSPLFLSLALAISKPVFAQETPEGQSFKERCDSACIDEHVDRIMEGINELLETTPPTENLSPEIPTGRVFQGCPEAFLSNGIPFEELPGLLPENRGEWADLLAQRLEWQCPGEGEGNGGNSGPAPTS